MATEDRQSELAYRTIRDMVRHRKLEAGQIVSENRLAKELGMGRTPVREAVLRLSHEGLFVMLPKRGILVRSMTLKDITELYEVRSRLETLAAYRAAAPGRMNEPGRARLAALIEEQAEVGAAEDPDLDRLRQIDRAFHMEIWEHAGNERLRSMLLGLLDAAALDPLWDNIMVLRRWNNSVAEHQAILAALADEDPVKAEAAMLEHNRSYQRLLVRYLAGDADVGLPGDGVTAAVAD